MYKEESPAPDSACDAKHARWKLEQEKQRNCGLVSLNLFCMGVGAEWEGVWLQLLLVEMENFTFQHWIKRIQVHVIQINQGAF